MNSGWAAGAHDIGKSTFPAARKSPGSGTLALWRMPKLPSNPIGKNIRQKKVRNML
jgi:hypothetical protein